ncbi:cytochrome P450 [Novosphingobium malaysiense]|uniref:Cytochrome P450 n=1 Tax=Novosphingobium malaysiense TaxID=1348853 RepID=A0A0B1ZNA9_9SPHN|nr:cytochrome P450 [Novosphingobium malaysiense]KHK92600.1 hypothetical protein LK12_07475 [Novosphingobium malaysiense]
MSRRAPDAAAPLIDADDLDLPFLPIEDPAFAADPASQFRRARDAHPWLARIGIGYIVIEHAAMREMMRNDARMVFGFNEVVEHMGASGTPWGEFIKGTIQVQSGDTHARLRNALRSAFSPRMANRYRDVMREQIDKLLDAWLPRGRFDFEEFASYYPISVMCRMLGMREEVIPEIRSSLEALGLAMSMDRRYLPELQRGTQLLEHTARSLIAQRRADGGKSGDADLLDMVLAVRESGEMSEDELVNLLIFMFVGGYDTSKNVITLMMHALIDRPGLYERCGESLEFTRKAMHETLRFHSPASALRKVVSDIDFRGVRFPSGSLVMFPWGFSGRDPTAVDEPDQFDPERKRPQGSHFAFGMGAHICLGQFIGMAQIEEGFHAIARRLRNPQRTGEPGWRPYPGTWGIAGLPIAFGPA